MGWLIWFAAIASPTLEQGMSNQHATWLTCGAQVQAPVEAYIEVRVRRGRVVHSDVRSVDPMASECLMGLLPDTRLPRSMEGTYKTTLLLGLERARKRALQAHGEEVAACITPQVADSNEVAATFLLAKEGRRSASLDVRGPALLDEGAATDCITAAMKSWTLPEGPTVSVTQTYDFSRNGPPVTPTLRALHSEVLPGVRLGMACSTLDNLTALPPTVHTGRPNAIAYAFDTPAAILSVPSRQTTLLCEKDALVSIAFDAGDDQAETLCRTSRGHLGTGQRQALPDGGDIMGWRLGDTKVLSIQRERWCSLAVHHDPKG